MDLRGIANRVSNTVNSNIVVSVQVSAGYTIGAGKKQIPQYNPAIVGPAQVQALDSSDLKQIDGLNLQGAIRAIYLRGVLAGVIRPNQQGGDLVTIAAPAPLPLQGTWLVTKVLESWPTWTKAVIVKQSCPSSGNIIVRYSDNEVPGVSGSQFTLLYAPLPPASLQLYVQAIGFGWILLEQGTDYTLSATTITIINGNTYGASYLRAWYRY